MSVSLLIKEQENMDEAIAKTCKGNKTIAVDQRSTFNLELLPPTPQDQLGTETKGIAFS